MNAPEQDALRPVAGIDGLAAAEPVSGPAFPVTVKALASLLMLAVVVIGARAGVAGETAPVLTVQGWVFLAGVLLVMATGYWAIMTSRTRIDGDCIEQSWFWPKKVRLAEVTQVKLISVRGLHWLIVPRLVTRTGFEFTTFHAGDPAVYARFRLLAYGKSSA